MFQAQELLRGRDLVLGPYVLQAELGKGGMGAVYQARHQMMKRQVALKVLRPGKMAGGAVRRFQQEIEAAAALSHPNIVTAHDAGRVGDIFYFAMEKLEGAPLSEVVARFGRLSVANACHYIRQAALGLDYAHERNMVHRDIKPANLFMTLDNTVKILDMGLVRVAEGKDGLTQLGTVMGTPDYIAPEQARDSHEVDRRADIYSLGCTLYHLLAGALPFPGKEPVSQKLQRHLSEEPASLRSVRADVPEGLAAVVRRMLAKKPADRFQTAAQVAAALEPFAQGAKPISLPRSAQAIQSKEPAPAVTAMPVNVPVAQVAAVPVAEAAQPASSLRKWLIIGGGAFLVLLVTVLWITFGTRRQEPEPIVDNGSSKKKEKKKEAVGRLLDRLKADNVPAELRWKNQPMELVAVLGDSRALQETFVYTAAVSPDGSLIASGTALSVRLSDAKTLREISALKAEQTSVHALAFADDSTMLVGAGIGFVFLWEIRDAKAPREIWRQRLDNETVLTAAFAPEGRIFLATSQGRCHLRDVSDGSEVAKWGEFDKAKKVRAALSPDGARVLSGDSTGRVWLVDVNTKAVTEWPKHESAVGRVAFSPRGDLAAIAGGGVTIVRDVKTGGQRQKLKNAEGESGLHFLSGGRLLAAAAIWDYTTAESKVQLRAHPGQDYLRFAVPFKDEPIAVVNDLRSLRLFDLDSGREILGAGPHGTAIRGLAFSPDGKYLVSGGNGFGDNPPLVRVWDLDTLQEAYRVQVPLGRGGLSRVVVSADSTFASALVSSNGNSRAQTWLLHTEEKRPNAPAYGNAATYTSAGKLLTGNPDGAVNVVDPESGKTLASLKRDGAKLVPSCVAVSADAKLAVTTVRRANNPSVKEQTPASEILLWDISEEKVIKTWADDKNAFYDACFSPDKAHLYAGGDDGRLWIWISPTWRRNPRSQKSPTNHQFIAWHSRRMARRYSPAAPPTAR